MVLRRNLMKIAFVPVLLLLAASPAAAQTATPDAPPSKFVDFDAIPDPLRMMLEQAQASRREQFVEEAVSLVRVYAADKQALTAQDVDRLHEQELHDRKLRQMQEIQKYDGNLDGKVTEAEVKEVLNREYPAADGVSEYQFHHRLAQIMSFDTDKDGTITLEEMTALPPQEPAAQSPNERNAAFLRAVLQLDPDGDGKLTSSEMEELAKKAFNTVDKGGGGVLSNEDINALRSQAASELPLVSPCKAPAPALDAKSVYLSANGVHGLSSFTVTGQEAFTGVVPVDIAGDSGKIHLVVTSTVPTIWVLRGHTENVAGVTVFGPLRDGKKTVAAGVSGVDAAKIQFRDSVCLAQGKTEAELRGLLKKLMKRDMDMMADHPDMRAASISAMAVSFKPRPDYRNMKVFDPAVPEGFDLSIWTSSVLGGQDRDLYDLSSEKIVSDSQVEMYKVLPGWPGLAKLVHDGAIVREGTFKQRNRVFNPINKLGPLMAHEIDVGGTYKIVRDIPYFPADVTGGPAYILGKGVALPKGDPKVCVTAEGTGDMLLREDVCYMNAGGDKWKDYLRRREEKFENMRHQR